MPASYVPNFMSELPAEMNFAERAFNLAWKLLGLSLMFFHCLRCDQNIARDGRRFEFCSTIFQVIYRVTHQVS